MTESRFKTVRNYLNPSIRVLLTRQPNRVDRRFGPIQDIMTLKDLRMAFANETDAGCRISASRIKGLTGNDILPGRNPHDKYGVQVNPSHTLFLVTWNKELPA